MNQMNFLLMTISGFASAQGQRFLQRVSMFRDTFQGNFVRVNVHDVINDEKKIEHRVDQGKKVRQEEIALATCATVDPIGGILRFMTLIKKKLTF